ncbi:MAG: DUF2279 domain-containing protein [Deltaproteobacteria bacterium]
MSTAACTVALLATIAGTTPDLRLKPTLAAPGAEDPAERVVRFEDADDDVDTSHPAVVIGITAGVTALIGAWAVDAWWSDGLEPFSFRDAGAFGQDTYAGGADKMGHAYSMYVVTHSVYSLYRWLGMTKVNAALWTGAIAFTVSNWVELIDGFTQYGFEGGDVIANSLGIGLGLLTKLSPRAESLVGFRLSYVPSPDFLQNEKSVLKWINDYTGMTYYLDVKGKGVLELMDRDPGLFRYVQAGIAFNTDQYSPVKRWEERRRNLGVHVGVSMSEVLRAWGDGDEGVEPIATFFDYYAVPFLNFALMKDLNDGGWFINFGVANQFESPL